MQRLSTLSFVDTSRPARRSARTGSVFSPGGGALAKEGIYKGAFVDPWGNPYLFKLDTSGTQAIANPDPQPADGEPTEIQARVIVWSAGKNAPSPLRIETDEYEWNDNPKSWW